MNYIRVTMPICKRKKKIERQHNNCVKIRYKSWNSNRHRGRKRWNIESAQLTFTGWGNGAVVPLKVSGGEGSERVQRQAIRAW